MVTGAPIIPLDHGEYMPLIPHSTSRPRSPVCCWKSPQLVGGSGVRNNGYWKLHLILCNLCKRSTINYHLIQHNGNTISRYSSDPVFSHTVFRYCPLSGNECTNYLRLSRSRSGRYTILPDELKLYPLLTVVR